MISQNDRKKGNEIPTQTLFALNDEKEVQKFKYSKVIVLSTKPLVRSTETLNPIFQIFIFNCQLDFYPLSYHKNINNNGVVI